MQPPDASTRYADILDLPHHRSATHPPMSAHDRAAQFSPFAALPGYHHFLAESARPTDVKIELDDSAQEVLNERLNKLRAVLKQQPKVSISYFLPNKTKAGGIYVVATGCVKIIDTCKRLIVLKEGPKIPMDDIVDLTGDFPPSKV